jgi:methyl-accepting chemotaxis protein
MRVFIGRQRDIGASASRVGEALERARLVALNAGLEGVRMSEPAGRAVAMVSDEVRQAVQRGIDALDDHRKLLDKLDEQQKKLQEQVRATETGACDLKQLLDQTRELQDKSSHILTELFDKAQEATGADKQTLRWMAEVGTRAQELLRLLAQAPGGAALQWSLDALRPALRALERRLSDLQADGEATGESSGNDS